MIRWVLLIYKIPREPTAGRVYVWRKLKRLGALALQDAVWVLPATPGTREQLQWLAVEIGERGGEILLWESTLIPPAQEATLIAQFVAAVDTEYTAILADLAQPAADPAALARRYQQVQPQDYFHSPLGQQVRAALLAARGGPDS
ncbi:MAG TPA: Chromate resistance protein ChrB [Chloroflexia bacterium]|nr:Chromate resistance protein ChrB [Chloroflexia bacterium]